MAKVKLRPVEPLILEFADGTTKTALFNNEAFIIFEEEFGELSTALESELTKNPLQGMAKMLYCALKVVEPSITLDEALQIMYMGGNDLFLEISRCIVENFDIRSNEEVKKKFLQHLETTLDKEGMDVLKKYKII